jgi:hypothetical protein
MTQEALKLALEFIENSECGTADLEARIKEALAQTQEPKIGCVNHDCDKCKAQTQEPVATVTSETGNPEITMSWWHEPALPVGTKLYTTPPQRTWVGLTDEERQEIWWSCEQQTPTTFVKAIEAKLKELNT